MKKLFTLCTLLCAAVALWANGVEIDGICYITSANGAEVTYAGTNPAKNTYTGMVLIPSSVTYKEVSYTVTAIGANAFYNCTGLTAVVLPTTIQTIKNYAFYNCTSLTAIALPAGVTTIEDHAFYNCTALALVDLPTSVTSIGAYAFCNCAKLTAVAVPAGVTILDDHVFAGCSSLATVTMGSSVTTIGNNAFSACASLTAIVLPEGLTTIGNYAFYDCTGLSTVSIPAGVTSIGDGAFDNCTGLLSIICYAVVPPALGSAVFTNVDSSIPLYVHNASIPDYKDAEQWQRFNILGLESPIDNVDAEEVPVVKFVRDGQLLIRRANGIYDANGRIVE